MNALTRRGAAGFPLRPDVSGMQQQGRPAFTNNPDKGIIMRVLDLLRRLEWNARRGPV